MKQLPFVQGGGVGAHDEWDDKLVDSLKQGVGPNFEIRYPRMPNEGDPAYAAWRAALEKEFARLDDMRALFHRPVFIVCRTVIIN